MKNWRHGRPRRAKLVVVAPRRRHWSWRLDGMDIRLPLAFVLPLAFFGGGLLSREPAGAGDSISTAADIVGVASVVDGDTLEIHGRRIRLDGIDAPESSQACVRNGARERCGRASAFYLSGLIGRRTVRCETHDVDRYGRDIATCWLGNRNLNEVMVAAGQAVAYRQYSGAYIEAEEKARAGAMGVWATQFEMPWEYRR